jgi:hypothetical protein
MARSLTMLFELLIGHRGIFGSRWVKSPPFGCNGTKTTTTYLVLLGKNGVTTQRGQKKDPTKPV